MCVICYTNANDISDDDLKKMWDANPDGAGFAYISEGKAHYSKGFLKYDDFLNALPENRTYLMLHFRIATHGLVNACNTHPFDILHPEQITGKTNRLLFHNGIFPVNWVVKKSDSAKYSDTFLLARDILANVKNKNMYDVILADSGSRFALFDASISKNRWYLYGDWQDYKGMNVSNLTFCTYTKWAGYTSRYPMGTAGTGRNYAEDDWRDEWYYDDEKTPPLLANPDEVVEGVSEDAEVCYMCKMALDEVDAPFGYCEDCGLENNFNCDQCGDRLTLDYLIRDSICEKCLTHMYHAEE